MCTSALNRAIVRLGLSRSRAAALRIQSRMQIQDAGIFLEYLDKVHRRTLRVALGRCVSA